MKIKNVRPLQNIVIESEQILNIIDEKEFCKIEETVLKHIPVKKYNIKVNKYVPKKFKYHRINRNKNNHDFEKHQNLERDYYEKIEFNNI